MKRFRLKKLALDEVSLVPAGDNPGAEVVIAKSNKTPDGDEGDRTLSEYKDEADHEEPIVPDDETTETTEIEIDFDSLDPSVQQYISQLEDTVVQQNEALAASDDVDDLSDDTIDQLAELLSEEGVLAKADPEVRALIEKAETRASEAEALAKAERDLRIHREFVEKAAKLPMLSTDAERLGEILKAVNEELSETDAAELTQILKTANDVIAEGNLFKEMGSSAPGTVGASVEAKAAEIRKADPSLTPEQAIARAYETDPSLYEQQES